MSLFDIHSELLRATENWRSLRDQARSTAESSNTDTESGPKPQRSRQVVLHDTTSRVDGLGTLGMLPPEIRRMIAKFVFTSAAPLLLTRTGVPAHPFTMVSWAIREETINLFWATTTFTIEATDSSFLRLDDPQFNLSDMAHGGLGVQMQPVLDQPVTWLNLSIGLTSGRSAEITSVTVDVGDGMDAVGLPMALIHNDRPIVKFVGESSLCEHASMLLNLCRSVFANGFKALKYFKCWQDPQEMLDLKLKLASFFEHSRSGKIKYNLVTTFIFFHVDIEDMQWVWLDFELLEPIKEFMASVQQVNLQRTESILDSNKL